MCVITATAAAIGSAVMGTLSAVGTAAAGAATALTGIGTVAAGTGIAGSSIGLTGAGLTGILTAGAGTAAGAGTMAGLGSAIASTGAGLAGAAGGLVVDTGAALTTKAFGAGAASFADSMAALGSTSIGNALGANAVASGATSAANAVGVQTAAQTALANSVLNGTMVNGEFIAAPASKSALAAVGLEGAGAAAGKTLLGEAAMLASGAGSVTEAVGAYQEGKDSAAIQKAQAKDEELRALQAIEAAETEAKDLARRQKHAVGTGRTAAAAGGVMLESRAESSPALWEQDAAAELAWDREKLFYNANQRASVFQHNANQLRIGAKNARRGGNLKAATAIIKGTAGMAVSAYGRPSATLYA